MTAAKEWIFVRSNCQVCGVSIVRLRLEFWPVITRPFIRCHACAARLWRFRGRRYDAGPECRTG